MARGRGGKTGGGGKSSGGSSSGRSRGRPSPKSKPKSKPRPSPTPPRPTPNRISTVNTSVSTQNSGRVNPRSVSTYNPSVSTQNNPSRIRFPTTQRPPTPAITRLRDKIHMTYPTVEYEIRNKEIQVNRPVNLPPIRLPNQTLSIQNVRYVENPNNVNPQVIQRPNLTPSETFVIPITKGELTQAATKEFALHLSGTKIIDRQRLQAIQEGRIIVTKGIETTFTPSEQQVRVLQAMEAQKKAEKEQSRANSEWQKKQDSLQAKIRQMEAAKQKTQEFRNRTTEEVLQNFIKVQTQKELSGDYGTNPEVPTNLNQYLTERGYDVTKPETIPTSVFKPTKLDTPEKLRAAGVAESIIHTIMGTERSVENPNDTITNVMTDTSIPYDRGINWSGITEQSCIKCHLPPCPCNLPPFRDTPTENNLFTPPNATNINQPIGRSSPLPPSVTTTGLSPPRTTIVEEVVEANLPIPNNLSSLALLAGALIIS